MSAKSHSFFNPSRELYYSDVLPALSIAFLNDPDNPKIYTTSVTGLSELKELEDLYIDELNEYTDLLQQKVHSLKLYLEKLKLEKLENYEQRVQYVSNPLKAFGLLRRTHQDWPKWHNYTKSDIGAAKLIAMEQLLAKAPGNDDMMEAYKGMHRIEEVYDLEAADMAKGLLLGKQYDAKMSTAECLALGDYMFNQSEFARAAKWYRLGLYYNTEYSNDVFKQIYGFESDEIRKMFLIARIKGASVDDVPIYLRELSHGPHTPLWKSEKGIPTAYQEGCWGRLPRRRDLTCRYNSTTSPFLRLAPLKMEMISLDPYIVIYRDVLSEHEIRLATDKSNYGVMFDTWTYDADPRIKLERISKGGMLYTKELSVVNKRIEDMTGLNVSLTDELQMANYGLGGHFLPHYDFVNLTRRTTLTRIFETIGGDRQVTVLFYTSDVELGGATLFPKLNITVRPEKGSALIWNNLDHTGQPDVLTEHGICPVIVGSRWTLTQTLAEWDQMFKKPCNTKI
ncbi:prolyl 4-hydroxylase subunit alpha-1-like [Scaptodrosophila lebanonensis]|uniref:procollagen-proline 4-dioxygenase n=1 Tax=Drosophila lebanonensis TaxID=7225 RepID=A0A6J2TA36_DROLE|nr:prolyl 4-hydroxylase subunit alpha-1-like [Scaptodrosophila lebanonensis]